MLARWLERRARCWGPPGPPPARPGPTVPRPPHRHRHQAGENLHCCWWAGPMVGGRGGGLHRSPALGELSIGQCRQPMVESFLKNVKPKPRPREQCDRPTAPAPPHPHCVQTVHLCSANYGLQAVPVCSVGRSGGRCQDITRKFVLQLFLFPPTIRVSLIPSILLHAKYLIESLHHETLPGWGWLLAAAWDHEQILMKLHLRREQ